MSEEMSIDTGAEPVESVQPEEGQEIGQEGDIPSGEISADANPEGSELVQENLETLKDQIQEAVEDGASKKEIKELIKEFELKVNGKTVKSKINLMDEEAVKRELQKAHAFNDVSQENANIKKALSAKIAAWKADPSQLFADLGVDATEFSASYLEKQIQESQKSPEQKALEQREREHEEMIQRLKAYEEKEAKLRQMIEEKQQQESQNRAIAELTAEIDGALSKSKVLSADEDMRIRMADMMAMYSRKYPEKEITADMVLPILEKKFVEETKKVSSKLSDDELEGIISKEQLQRLLNKHLQKSGEQVAPKKAEPVLPSQAKPTSQPLSVKKEEPKRAKSFEDALRMR